jgi:hypothetical protein
MPAGHQHSLVLKLTAPQCSSYDAWKAISVSLPITIYIHHGTGGRVEKRVVVELVKAFPFHGTVSFEVSGLLGCYTEQQG